MQDIPCDDARLTWSGAISLQRGDGWVKPWRVPHEDLDLYSPGVSQLGERAGRPSGVRLRFSTDSRHITCRTEPMGEAGNVDLCVDGILTETVAFEAGETSISFAAISSGPVVVEVWLNSVRPVLLAQPRD